MAKQTPQYVLEKDNLRIETSLPAERSRLVAEGFRDVSEPAAEKSATSTAKKTATNTKTKK